MPLCAARPVSNGMDEDVINPVPPAEGEEGDDKEVDPDMIEDTFDDVDPL